MPGPKTQRRSRSTHTTSSRDPTPSGASRQAIAKEKAMLYASKTLGAFLLAGTAALCCTAPIASAQPLTFPVTPSGGRTFTDAEGTWERVAASALWANGPSYAEPSGVRIGRGSVIPDWIDAAPVRNVSIRGLDYYQHYAYFVSPDD